MIEQFRFQDLTQQIIFSDEEKEYIDKLPLKNASEWNISDNTMKKIKETIKLQLMKIQDDFCIYCGLQSGSVGSFDREHIVSKARNPEFMFTPNNLALACKTCNGTTRKGQKKIIIGSKKKDYNSNNFCIVHPYLDKRQDHIEYASDHITLKGITIKGIKTIEMFDLNNSSLLNIRGSQYIMSQLNLTNQSESIIEIIMNRLYRK